MGSNSHPIVANHWRFVVGWSSGVRLRKLGGIRWTETLGFRGIGGFGRLALSGMDISFMSQKVSGFGEGFGAQVAIIGG